MFSERRKKSIISILTNMFPTEYIMLLLLAHTFEMSECQIFSYNLSILGEEWAQLLQILRWGQDSTCRAHDRIYRSVRFKLKNTTSYMSPRKDKITNDFQLMIHDDLFGDGCFSWWYICAGASNVCFCCLVARIDVVL